MSSSSEALELTYAMGTASRLTGLSPDVLRAWERRHSAVTPLRTEGGTRRYRSEDVERLRLLKQAVAAGHRIGELAALDNDQIQRRLSSAPAAGAEPRDALLAAIERIDAPETERLLAEQLANLGPVRFAKQLALPLVREIGARWAAGELSIAAEHMATSVLRSKLGGMLRASASARRGPLIAFATPPGERHDLGLLMAALVATGAGANPLFLGSELPLDDLARAVSRSGASVLALGLVHLERGAAEAAVTSLRSALAGPVRLWLGGARAAELEPPPGVERLGSFDELERRVAVLCLGEEMGA